MHYLVIIVLCMSFHLNGQAQKSKTENRFEGYIIFADSVKKVGIIEIEDVNQPWTFQENVKFFDKALLSAGRVKREQKFNCNPGEIIEYGINDRVFKHVSYYVKNLEEDNILKSTYGRIKGDKNTDYFAEVFKSGKVSLLKFYIPPSISEDDYDNDELMKEYVEKSKTSYDILITRGVEKPKSIDDISIKNFFKDCDFVVKKYNDSKYKLKPGKSLKAMFKGDKLPGSKLEEAARDIVADFELHCNK